jgi:molybdopterin synthase sulfur carrier subunit
VITVRLPAALRPYAGGQAKVEVDRAPCPVAELLATLERIHPGVGRRITDEQGRVRTHVHIYIGEERASLDDTVADGAEVSILAAASGG